LTGLAICDSLPSTVGYPPSRLAVALRVLLVGRRQRSLLVSQPAEAAGHFGGHVRTEKRASTRKSVPLPEGVNKRLTAYALAAGAASSEGVSKRLTAYALAAGAAGVGVLALAEPAQADIIVVTTPISIVGCCSTDVLTIKGRNVLRFAASFGISHTTFGIFNHNFLVAAGARSGAGLLPSPLAQEALIGRGGKFVSFPISALLASNFSSRRLGFSSKKGVVGPWANKSGYLGFKFLSNEQTDFGWAHVKVTASTLKGETLYISEFAYDTVPGQSIRAGQTNAIPEPGTLSLLALGAAGLAVLRKRKASAASRQGSASG
jgi:PEP-CTERM motif